MCSPRYCKSLVHRTPHSAHTLLAKYFSYNDVFEAECFFKYWTLISGCAPHSGGTGASGSVSTVAGSGSSLRTPGTIRLRRIQTSTSEISEGGGGGAGGAAATGQGEIAGGAAAAAAARMLQGGGIGPRRKLLGGR